MFVLASIAVLCIETHPRLRVPLADKRSGPVSNAIIIDKTKSSTAINDDTYHVVKNAGGETTYANTTTPSGSQGTTDAGSDPKQHSNFKVQLLMTTQPHPVLEHIDSFCTCFFTVEFLIRFIVAPNRIKFWKSVMNIIDVLCVLPMWIKYAFATLYARIP